MRLKTLKSMIKNGSVMEKDRCKGRNFEGTVCDMCPSQEFHMMVQNVLLWTNHFEEGMLQGKAPLLWKVNRENLARTPFQLNKDRITPR